jgi:diadenosine tetraphosphate (Ap4A) HIT family hydrolase
MDLVQALSQDVAPWRDVYHQGATYVVFRDKFPVAPGHLLFVPRQDDLNGIMDCYRAAHQLGDSLVSLGQADAYNVGINRGVAAGQTVMYPHVHLIPRRVGDCADPVGGVRGVIAGQANYRAGSYQQC